MANADRPRGLEPWGQIKQVTPYEAGSAIGIGDAVSIASDGQVDPVSLLGTIYSSSVLGVAISAASTAGDRVLVCDHPDQQFRIQADDSSINAQTDMGLNYSIVGTSASGGNSQQELDGSSGATDSTLPLRLLRLDIRPDNALGAAADCIVKINNHQLGNKVEGV